MRISETQRRLRHPLHPRAEQFSQRWARTGSRNDYFHRLPCGEHAVMLHCRGTRAAHAVLRALQIDHCNAPWWALLSSCCYACCAVLALCQTSPQIARNVTTVLPRHVPYMLGVLRAAAHDSGIGSRVWIWGMELAPLGVLCVGFTTRLSARCTHC